MGMVRLSEPQRPPIQLIKLNIFNIDNHPHPQRYPAQLVMATDFHGRLGTEVPGTAKNIQPS